MPKPNKIIKLSDLSIDCPKCGNKLWQVMVRSTRLKTPDDIIALECECGFRVEFGEEE